VVLPVPTPSRNHQAPLAVALSLSFCALGKRGLCAHRAETGRFIYRRQYRPAFRGIPSAVKARPKDQRRAPAFAVGGGRSRAKLPAPLLVLASLRADDGDRAVLSVVGGQPRDHNRPACTTGGSLSARPCCEILKAFSLSGMADAPPEVRVNTSDCATPVQRSTSVANAAAAAAKAGQRRG